MLKNDYLLRPAEKLINNWGWFLFLGILLIIGGVAGCIAMPFATEVFVFFMGFMLLFAGILQIIQSFYASGWGGFFLWLLAGVIYTIAGVLCFTNPMLTAIVMTLLLGILLIIAGIFRLIVGFDNKGVPGWGWVIFAAILSILLGVMVILQWPIGSIWILGLFFAIDIMFQGFSWVAIGIGLKSLKN